MEREEEREEGGALQRDHRGQVLHQQLGRQALRQEEARGAHLWPERATDCQ